MYENITYEMILQRMLDRIPEGMDTREGSIIYDALAPAAVELQLMYIEFDVILKETFADTASRDYLIKRCAERGITPYPATYAILRGEFTPVNIDVTGKRFNISDQNYVVTEKIADGVYQVQCETLGTTGNLYLGTMIPIEYVEGLETAELTETLIPGEDEEETEALRERYFDSFNEKAFGGNREDYLQKANGVAGVGSTKVTPVWNGDIRPADMIPSAKVKNWYDSIAETLDQEVALWLSSVYMAATEKKLTVGGTVLLTVLNSEFSVASDTLIQTVKETFDPDENAGEGYGLAPIGHLVSVQTATATPVTVKTHITFDTGYGWANLQTSINETIEAYLLELRKDWANNNNLIVRISQIETRLLTIKGIVDIDTTKINGVEDTFTLGAFEIPVFGGASA